MLGVTAATLLLVLVVVTALAFDFTNGFHDTANAMATSIATKALAPRTAVALCAVLNLIGAFLSDYLGNLTYALTARNFNPMMAMAADKTIVTAEHVVPVGFIPPDHVVTPAPLVDYVIANG